MMKIFIKHFNVEIHHLVMFDVAYNSNRNYNRSIIKLFRLGLLEQGSILYKIKLEQTSEKGFAIVDILEMREKYER